MNRSFGTAAYVELGNRPCLEQVLQLRMACVGTQMLLRNTLWESSLLQISADLLMSLECCRWWWRRC